MTGLGAVWVCGPTKCCPPLPASRNQPFAPGYSPSIAANAARLGPCPPVQFTHRRELQRPKARKQICGLQAPRPGMARRSLGTAISPLGFVGIGTAMQAPASVTGHQSPVSWMHALDAPTVHLKPYARGAHGTQGHRHKDGPSHQAAERDGRTERRQDAAQGHGSQRVSPGHEMIVMEVGVCYTFLT